MISLGDSSFSCVGFRPQEPEKTSEYRKWDFVNTYGVKTKVSSEHLKPTLMIISCLLYCSLYFRNNNSSVPFIFPLLWEVRVKSSRTTVLEDPALCLKTLQQSGCSLTRELECVSYSGGSVSPRAAPPSTRLFFCSYPAWRSRRSCVIHKDSCVNIFLRE